MANRRFTQFFWTLHKYPVQLDCIFQVDNTQPAGVSGLKGAGIQNVFMHTTTTPASGSPNPAAGLIYVQLQDNYKFLYEGRSHFRSPPSGVNIGVTASGAALTVGQAYQIVSLGTTTTANWVTLGVPIGTTPAVGVPFIAAATGAGTGTGQVQAYSASGVDHAEVLSDPNLTISSSSATVAGQTNGAYVIYQCLSGGVVTAPTQFTWISLALYLSNTRINVQGS